VETSPFQKGVANICVETKLPPPHSKKLNLFYLNREPFSMDLFIFSHD